jgi:hypothetical protein
MAEFEEECKWKYNNYRPHASLNGATPMEYIQFNKTPSLRRSHLLWTNTMIWKALEVFFIVVNIV